MIAIGVGCRKACMADEIVALVRETLAKLDGAGTPGGLYTLAEKACEPGLVQAAASLRLRLHGLDRATLQAAGARVSMRSQRIEALFGLPGVAEAAALAGAGEDAVLLVPRRASAAATAPSPARAQFSSLRSDSSDTMTIHFIGAGPGAADLITLRGRDLIAQSPVCLYAGSIIPKDLLRHCPAGARIVDTAGLDLDAIVAEFARATAAGQDVARLQSGDLSIWSATGEQMRRCDERGIAYTMTPGVPAFAAAAAALRRELTLPEVAQSLVLTRTSGRASAMPPRETIAGFAATGATLAVHLSIHALDRVVAEAMPFYGEDCPAAVVAWASWPQELIVRATLGSLVAEAGPLAIERTALILIGPALGAETFRASALYDAGYRRRFRGGA